MEYTKDLVSVIIPTYNQEKFIAETLESVINQTYTNLEIIVMDDGSTDRNPEIIREYAAKYSRIVPILSAKNEGFSKNTNKGLRRVSGEFVAKLDGDDIMMPTRIEKQVKALKKDKDNALCFTNSSFFNSESGKILYSCFDRQPVPETPLDWVFFNDWLIKGKTPSIQYTTVLARSEYYVKNLWDLRLPYKNEVLHTLDNYVSTPDGKWLYIDECLTKYRVFSDSMSRKKKDPLFLLSEQRIYFGIATTKYPWLYKRIKRQNNFYLFQSLLFDFIPENLKKQFENILLSEAGWHKYFYYKLAYLYMKLKNGAFK